MKGVLNEFTQTVHRHEPGAVDPNTPCGVAYHLDPDQLAVVAVEHATDDLGASKCGRCFDDGGGY